jgi:hypothetical protein
MVKKCPPGIVCMTPSIVILISVIVIIGVFFYMGHKTSPSPHKRTVKQPVYTDVNVNVRSGDDRYTRAPEPYRMWQTIPDLRGAIIPPGAMAINMPVRNLPEAYQQMGYIKADEQLLPLFGRRTGRSNDRFNYYTRTDSYNPIQVPITVAKRDCSEDLGCEELFGGETVQIRGLGKSGTVDVYKFDGPTYIPSII